MKVLNKIKSIYLLAIVAILSFCMLLFPAMPKTANAEGTMGEGSVKIKTARVVVQQYAQGEKWAIMFKAELPKDQYDIITQAGLADVKFGMLIGPSAKLRDATTYDALVENKFKPISYVGSVAGEGIQAIEYAENATTYEYWGAIVYDDAQLNTQENGDRRVDAAEMELTAIPFYTDGENSVAVMAGAKSATPRNILVESYLRQADGEEAVVDGVGINADTTVKNYAGEIEFFDGDAYICRSTNRLMVGEKQGELAPASFDIPSVEFVIGGVARTATDATAVYADAEKLANLPKYGKVNVVGYTPEGIGVYKAQVAERVIMRFADTTVGVAVEDATADYMSVAQTKYYKSIFFSGLGGQAAAGINMYFTSEKIDGLYVLGTNIASPSNHAMKVHQAGSYGFYNNIAYNAKKVNGAYTEGTGEGWYVRSSYTIPTGNAGFNGILDGRGFTIDLKSKAKYGVIPPAFNATVKNVALLNLCSNATDASYYQGDFGGLCTSARNTTFENIYATYTTTTNYTADMSIPLVATLDNCVLNNFVVEANVITDAVMTASLTYGANSAKDAQKIVKGDSGYGQGKTTSGVFSFRSFSDAYIDANGSARSIANSSISADWNNFYNNYKPEYLNKEITQGNVKGTRLDYYNTNAKDAFAGTTGYNVYAVGSSPLYVNHEVNMATGTGADYNNYPSLDPTTKTTVFVNSTLQYNGVDENEQPAVLNTDTTSYYKLSSLVDTDGLFVMNAEDGKWTLGEIILKGKQFRFGVDKVANMLATTETNELEVRLITKEGWYDVADTTEMAKYVKANAENGVEFDSAFWNVVDGIVSWKNLPQA